MFKKLKQLKDKGVCFLTRMKASLQKHRAAAFLSAACLVLCVATLFLALYISKNRVIIEIPPQRDVVAGASVDESVSTTSSGLQAGSSETQMQTSTSGTEISEDTTDNIDFLESTNKHYGNSEENPEYTIYDAITNVNTSRWESISYGIDVSGHNGKIDWQKVAASGVEFAMIRCGYRGYVTGKIIEDKQFAANIMGAYKNGISVGIYFYSTAISEAEAREEAEWVCRILEQQKNKGIEITYPVAYDFEEFYNKNKSRSENVTKAQLTKNTIAFLNYIANEEYTPMLYASRSSIKSNWDFNAVSGYDFWLAHYIDATDYESEYAMWQYSCKGRVNGIGGNVDLNVSYYRYVNNGVPVITTAGNISVHNGPSDKSSVGGTIVGGVTYERTRTLVNGWSEIIYNGSIGYVKTNLLKKIEFTVAKSNLKLDEETTAFLMPIATDKFKTTRLSKGANIKITGVCEAGWYRIEHDGKETYIKQPKN